MSGGAKGSQQAGETTSTQGPPSWMLPFISRAIGQADNLLSAGGPQYYSGPTVAGFSDPQQQAMQKIFNMGIGKTGQGGLNAATRFDKTLLNGGGENPYLDAMYKQAAGATQNQLSSEFAGSGRNTAAAEPMRGEQLNNLATSLYGGAYDNDQNRALQAGNQVQDIYKTRMQGLGAAEGVGQQVQNLGQQQIDASKSMFDYDQNLPYKNLQQYISSLGGLSPGGQSSSPFYDNPTANLMGTALAGQQLYNGSGGKGGKGGSASSASSNPYITGTGIDNSYLQSQMQEPIP